MDFSPRNMTRRQAIDSGLALVLIVLLFAGLGRQAWAVPTAIALVLLLMVWPGAFKPFASLWLGLSHLLGSVMSRVLLTVVFYLVVMPVGLVRRAAGKDSLRLKAFKKGNDSVFRVRDHQVRAEDLERPY